MHSELHHHTQKIGQPPGTVVYAGKKTSAETQITITTYNENNFQEETVKNFSPPSKQPDPSVKTWIRVNGLQDSAAVIQLMQYYDLHPLTQEDIFNVEQRPKVEEFERYLFITLKMPSWNKKTHTFSMEQLSLIWGKNHLISFQNQPTQLLNTVLERMRGDGNQRLRQQSTDYLAYRLIDTAIDQYFMILENMGEKIEVLEEKIILNPTRDSFHALYQLKRQMLWLRKAIWPMREIISHLLQMDEAFVTPFTQVYLRDVYDHTVQAIDTLETFRDMLSNISDVYLSSSANRMNEIMKVLTIIATIFIPITFVTSLYGMNFHYMPELEWHWGYFTVLGVMGLSVLGMLFYFRRKKWI